MPKRSPAIDDETLRREAGMLADEVLLLPRQVVLLTGLTEWQLKDRGRARPPKPPLPEPKENPKDLPWYSLGAVREFRKWREEQAEINAVMADRKRNAERWTPGFSQWLETPAAESWPIALLGVRRRPVDAWATIRGEVAMGRSDRIVWMDLDEYLAATVKWVEATRVALERQAAKQLAAAHKKLAAAREKQLNARATSAGRPKGRS